MACADGSMNTKEKRKNSLKSIDTQSQEETERNKKNKWEITGRNLKTNTGKIGRNLNKLKQMEETEKSGTHMKNWEEKGRNQKKQEETCKKKKEKNSEKKWEK